MGAETKVIGKVEYVTDTDVSYYKMGEVETSFDLEALKNYIKRYGHETLCSGLSYMHSQIWEMVREINGENDCDNNNVSK